MWFSINLQTILMKPIGLGPLSENKHASSERSWVKLSGGCFYWDPCTHRRTSAVYQPTACHPWVLAELSELVDWTNLAPPPSFCIEIVCMLQFPMDANRCCSVLVPHQHWIVDFSLLSWWDHYQCCCEKVRFLCKSLLYIPTAYDDFCHRPQRAHAKRPDMLVQ